MKIVKIVLLMLLLVLANEAVAHIGMHTPGMLLSGHHSHSGMDVVSALSVLGVLFVAYYWFVNKE